MKRSLVAATAFVLVSVSIASAAVVPVKVKGRVRIDEFLPAANGTYLIWSANSIAHPRHYDAWVEPLDKSTDPVMMNAVGSLRGFTGSTVNGNEAMFQEVTAGARVTRSNIYFFDVETKVRSAPPAGVNTSDWEWAPSSSPGFILFGRNRFDSLTAPWDVVLFDRLAGTQMVLDSVKNRCGCIYPGSVTDSYATWAKCVTVCQVYYYDIVAGLKHLVPNPLGKFQYSSALSQDSSSVYLVRSGRACGAGVKLMRWDVGGGDPVIVTSLADLEDIWWSPGVYTDIDGHDHVYYGQIHCGGKYYTDIYRVDDTETVSVAVTSERPALGTKRIVRPDARP